MTILNATEAQLNWHPNCPPDPAQGAWVNYLLIPMLSFLKELYTVTLGNGREFSYYEQVSSSLGSAIYFASPYHS
jgi:IS30 family transposase